MSRILLTFLISDLPSTQLQQLESTFRANSKISRLAWEFFGLPVSAAQKSPIKLSKLGVPYVANFLQTERFQIVLKRFDFLDI